MAGSLSIVHTLICSSDEDLQQTGRIHADFPCLPIAVLQPPATGANEIFDLQFFHHSNLPGPLTIGLKTFPIFAKNSPSYLNLELEKTDYPGYHIPQGVQNVCLPM